MKTYQQKQNDARIAEQASEWMSRLDGAAPAEHEAFAKWLTESRRNVEELLFAAAVDKALDDADPQREFDVKRLMQEAQGNVLVFEAQNAPTPALPRCAGEGAGMPPRPAVAEGFGPWRSTYARWVAGFAAIAILLAALWSQRPDLLGGWERYTTAVGEQRTLRLQDGSLIQLNTRSHLEVLFTPEVRELRLIEGEALFQVRRDAARAFRVNAGNAVVQALGTQFNIYRHGERATVAVIEGAVRVESSSPTHIPAQLAAGQEASIADSGDIIRRPAADVQRAVAWRQRRLMFHKDTLADIAEQFNRYNRSPQIRIEGDAVRAKRYTGVFDADDPGSLIDYLKRDGSLTFERRSDELWIQNRESMVAD